MSDEGSGSEDLTAEEQNKNNSQIDDMKNVLTGFLDSKEESLEDLVDGFIYLTMGMCFSNSQKVPWVFSNY